MASTNGADSMSPTVPPSYTVATVEAMRSRADDRAHLYDAHVRFFAGIVHRDFGDAFNPVLDGIRDMGDDLDGLSEIVAPPLVP